MANVVKVVGFKLLGSHRCGFEFQQGLWIITCKQAIQLAFGTLVVLHRFPFVPEIMHRRSSYTSKTGKSPYVLYWSDVT
jgi:hypothetical protein